MNKDIKITTLNKSWTTESGYSFSQVDIAWKSWGTLNENRDNVILICHALTGHAAADEWFNGLFDKGGILNPEKHFILCINIPGSCYGSTGPASINPETGKPWQADFPDITIRDIVAFQQLLLDHWDIQGIELVIGGSLGGMTALEFAIMDDRIKSAALFAMGKAHSPWAIGISQAQRMAIYADERWNNGFYDPKNPPTKGLTAARAMAMLTYRTPENYAQKFGREVHPEKEIYQVESYLNYQGEKLAGRFDANSYITLTKAMDSHDVSRGRGSFEEVLGGVHQPVLVVGFESDKLYPLSEQQELAKLIPNSRLAELQSPFGHDAFLIEFDQLNTQLHSFYHSLTEVKP
ncbi:MAG: homoserine O-acetyltransferase [Gracilimonas sp.]|uniref:homoserine O-acetyltransferase MetX n=1 Tax=Gracilimonas sp. TaxID=1974203 RepID=UPI001B16C2F3|nr:homoserine O-acetyltransferase [Gracilimonas sp.]MBO6585651.1 homoserine O-acetyltransferase [Gracilimonas sp.]MBO6616648.1 homoserine O-acetyltransferase [Gracilimonas sp.]